MDITQIAFDEFRIRDIDENLYSFGGKITFEFSEGSRCSRVTTECASQIPKGTSITDARAKVIDEALALVRKVAGVSRDQIEQSAAKWNRWQPLNEDQSLVVEGVNTGTVP